MKKAYFTFAAVMLVAVIAFVVARSFLNAEEEKAQRQQTREMVSAELAKYKVTVDSRLDEAEKGFLAKLDSLSSGYEEPGDLGIDLDSLGNPRGDSTAIDSVPADSATASRKTTPDTSATLADSAKIAQAAAGDTADTADSATPTEQDNEIYIRYLKKRWVLPTDLTKYELAVAKQEIMAEVGNDYDMTADEVLSVIDKVYEYRQALKKKDN